MIVAAVGILAGLTVAMMMLALSYRARAQAAEDALVSANLRARHSEQSLREFQIEQTELLLRSAEGKAQSEDLTPFEMAYIYRSLNMEPPPELLEAERTRDEVLNGILADLDRLDRGA